MTRRLHEPQNGSTLHIHVASDLSALTFLVDEEEMGVINSPRLLWECSCHTSEGGRSPSNGPCAVHSLPAADTIGSLFGKGTWIHFRGVAIRWDGRAGWPPSIDSLFFVKELLDHGWPGPTEHRWDVGAGTGFVGMQLANAHTGVVRLTGIEASASAANVCERNYHRLPVCAGRSAEVLCGRAEEILPDRLKPNDAIVSNPPYMPCPPWESRAENRPNPAMGTGMLQRLIRLASETEARLALEYSSLAQADVDRALAEGDGLSIDLLAERRVPLRLSLSPRYAEWLVSERGLIIDETDVFAHQHVIRVITL